MTTKSSRHGRNRSAGWEDPNCLLRGHFSGHWLSASALMWNATRNATLQQHMQYVVAELGKCQVRHVHTFTLPRDAVTVTITTAEPCDTKGGRDLNCTRNLFVALFHACLRTTCRVAITHHSPICVELPLVVPQAANAATPPTFGYLSGYPASQFTDLENLVPYPKQWSPYYTIHKIMAGLRDQYLYAGSQQALQLAEVGVLDE